MTVAIASSNNSGWTSTTSTSVTKPTGLAVGDLMIGYVASNGNSVGYPSGFSELQTFTNTVGSALSTFLCYKYADSSDVAASTFSFNINTPGTANNFCALLRVTGGVSIISLFEKTSGTTTNTATPSLTGVTPNSRGNSLLLQFWHGGSNVNSISTYAIATSNPSWSELYDVASGGLCASMAYATRPEVTATGNFSCAGGDASSDWGAFLIAIPPIYEVNISETTTLTETDNQNISLSIAETTTLTEDYDVDDSIMWNTQDINTAVWDTQDK